MYKYKRNGFTLVELMAVIIIISLIAILTFPNIINQIKKTKKSNNKMIEDVVIEQAKKYIHDNDSEYTEDDEYCIPLTKLIDNDYIKEDLISINDIKDNKVIHLTRTEKDSYEIMDKDKCVIIPTAVKYLLKKTNPITVTNYTDGDNCRTDNGGTPTQGWIYNTNSNSSQWLLSTRSNVSYGGFRLVDSGYVDTIGRIDSGMGVRPSLYLVSDVKIDSGDGTEQNPYKLKL